MAERLTDKPYWETRVTGHGMALNFDTRSPNFRDLDGLLKKCLPVDESWSFLEVGCHPGRFLWYFRKFFAYQVAGVEYVDACCKETEASLSSHDVPAEIFNQDFFEFEPPESRAWDVVASFGFVEHFTDFKEPVRRHCELVRDGGFVVISIPNHTGLGGKIMRRFNPDRYKAHNQMSYQQLEDAVLSCADMHIVEGGYLGRIGFWNIGLYPRIAKWPGPVRVVVKSILRVLERLGRFIPNSRFFSPDAAIIARKQCAAGG